jgi:GntR family phosphonate transport system transcriptional regulator
LALGEGELVIWLETLRLVNGRPSCLISHFLPHAGFEAVNEIYVGGPLHAFLRRRFGVKLREVEELAAARLPQGDDAMLLAVPVDVPLLRVKRVHIDDRSGMRVEYALVRFRVDRPPPHLEL